MIDSLNKVIQDIILLLFADDTTFIKSGANIPYIVQTLREALDTLVKWTDTRGFKINVDKTCAVLFSYTHSDISGMLKINGLSVPVSNQFKFLGVIFDRRLTWTPHVNYLKSKCFTRLNILRRLTGVHWGSSMHTRMLLYRALVKSVILYGAVALGGTSDTNLHNLEIIQIRAAMIASGAISCTCSADLLALVGEAPIKFDILKKVYKLGLKASYQTDTYVTDIFRETWHRNYGDYTSRYSLLYDLYLPFAVSIFKITHVLL